jgi:hypothetical protein
VHPNAQVERGARDFASDDGARTYAPSDRTLFPRRRSHPSVRSSPRNGRLEPSESPRFARERDPRRIPSCAACAWTVRMVTLTRFATEAGDQVLIRSGADAS